MASDVTGPDDRSQAFFDSLKGTDDGTPGASRLTLEEVEQLLALLADATDDGLWWLEYRRGRMIANEALARTFGYPREELNAPVAFWQEILHPSDRSRVAIAWERARDQRTSASYLARVRRPDGTYINTTTVGRVFYDDSGDPRLAVGYVRDLSSRRRSSAMTQRFFNRAPDLLARISLTGHIEALNPAWRRTLGWSDEQLLGRHLVDLLHDEDIEAIRTVAETVRSGLEINELRCRLQRSDGSYCWCLWSCTPVVEEGHAIIAGRDLSDQLAAEDALVEAREEALAASKAKSTFLATMSHEIRTPLNGVIGLTSLLLDGDLSGEQRHLAETLRRSGEALLNIVNDVLDLSKIEAGRLEIERRAFNPGQLVDETAALFAEGAQRKGLSLEVELEELPPRGLGDPSRLRQVLVNLLSNALKFTSEGKIRVAAKLIRGQAPPMLQVRVVDSGCGIAPEHLEAVFSPFAQADSSTARRFGGSGLGLSISRQLIELMGGTIEVDSHLGEGSRFIIEVPLPLARIRSEYRGPSGEFRAVGFDGVRLLLAEDNPVNQLVARKQLERFGCEVTVANDGRAALEALQQRDFDIVLMDCQMPELDGYATTRALRELPAPISTLPVIAVTANALEGERQRCFEAGMDDYLPKPFRPLELQQVLSRWLHQPEP